MGCEVEDVGVAACLLSALMVGFDVWFWLRIVVFGDGFEDVDRVVTSGRVIAGEIYILKHDERRRRMCHGWLLCLWLSE